MQNFRVLRTISLILISISLVFGCATSKSVSGADFEITAEATEEGIVVTFINLPQDTTHLWIQFTSWGDTKEPENPLSVVTSYAGITDSSVDGWVISTQNLDKIKQTGQIVFPFVQAGTRYFISVTAHNENEFRAMRNEDFSPRTANTEFVADNGIYFNRNNVKLELDEAHSTVTLSSEPIFSSDVNFDEIKYRFGVRVLLDDGRSIGIGDHHYPAGLSADGLSWTFEPHFTNILRTDNVALDWLEAGKSYPAFADVHANIIYDDIRWVVEIAKSPEYIFNN